MGAVYVPLSKSTGNPHICGTLTGTLDVTLNVVDDKPLRIISEYVPEDQIEFHVV